jgi:predicted Zn-dependent protease with MMP-like domain
MTTPDNPDALAPGWAEFTAPDCGLSAQLARDAVVNLPAPWRAPATQVALRVVDFAPQDLLDEMDLHDPFELTGLYDGTPLTEKSVMDQPDKPDVIWLFRRPILDEWAERGDVGLGDLVAHVMVHELAHHFGWSDEDIAAIDPWWE